MNHAPGEAVMVMNWLRLFAKKHWNIILKLVIIGQQWFGECLKYQIKELKLSYFTDQWSLLTLFNSRSLGILLDRFNYSKLWMDTEDLIIHYLDMEIDYKVAIYLRIWLHLNENMQIFRKFYNNVSK